MNAGFGTKLPFLGALSKDRFDQKPTFGLRQAGALRRQKLGRATARSAKDLAADARDCLLGDAWPCAFIDRLA